MDPTRPGRDRSVAHAENAEGGWPVSPTVALMRGDVVAGGAAHRRRGCDAAPIRCIKRCRSRRLIGGCNCPTQPAGEVPPAGPVTSTRSAVGVMPTCIEKTLPPTAARDSRQGTRCCSSSPTEPGSALVTRSCSNGGSRPATAGEHRAHGRRPGRHPRCRPSSGPRSPPITGNTPGSAAECATDITIAPPANAPARTSGTNRAKGNAR